MRRSRHNRTRKPARGQATRTIKRRILVVCEGEVTEPTYIQEFHKWCRNSVVEIKIGGKSGVPRTLAVAARDEKKKAEKDAKKQKDDFLAFDEVWCVFDIDDHPVIEQAQDIARDNDIHLAISNPCFELWLLLHFQESPGPQDRKHLPSMLRKYMKDYDKKPDFNLLHPGYKLAVQRARRIDDDLERRGEERGNPSTGVYRLTESIRRKD